MEHIFRGLLWAAAIAIVLLHRRSRLRERAVVGSLAVVAALAAASHVSWGEFHGDGRVLHRHELFNYTIGSKYFPELGYDGLYFATHRALVENDGSFYDRVSVVKNLRTYQFESKDVCLARSNAVASLFTEERWLEFRDDVGFFRTLIPDEEWRFLLIDHGYNATPFWTALGSLLSANVEVGHGLLRLEALIDPLLLAAMLVLLWRTFGAQTALLFAVFFFANSFGTFEFTGGAFLRNVWILSLVACLCSWKQGRMALAGGVLAVAVLDRVFPVLFVLLPAVLFVRESLRRRSLRHEWTRFLASFAAALLVLGGLSAAATGGLGAWVDCYDNISAHSDWFFINQISLRNLFLVDPSTSYELAFGSWDESLWLRERESLDALTRGSLFAVRASLLALLVALMAKEERPFVSLGLLSFAPFLLLYPAGYYCVFLLPVIVLWESSLGLALALMALQIPFWCLRIALPTPAHEELRNWIVSLCLLLAFAAFLTAALLGNARGSPVFRRSVAAILVAGALALAAGVTADARGPRAVGGATVVDLTPRDVRSAEGAEPVSERMNRWGNGWARNDHLLFLAAGPAARATVDVLAPRTGTYRVRVDYTAAPSFGVVELAVNGRAPFAPVDLFATQVRLQAVVHDSVALDEGPNAFAFAVVGSNPVATDFHFAIDRITLTETAFPSRREAVDRAVAWILAHPADPFDGGRGDIGLEIVALQRLGAAEDEVRARIGRLNDLRVGWVPLAEYEPLAAATHVARGLGLDLEAWAAMEDGVREWAARPFNSRNGVRPAFLCAYLRRLDPEAEPCGLERSASAGAAKLVQRMAGSVDPRDALVAITQEVFGLTDYGAEPLPPGDAFADADLWARLCELGLQRSMEGADVPTTARVILCAQDLGIGSRVPSLERALDFLVRHQEPDGSFGATDPSAPNAFREGTCLAALAIAANP